MHVRPFQNSDPPLLCEIWRGHTQLRGKYHGITPAVWERIVFSKLYFDPQGLFLAIDGERPVGFVHAAFGIAANQQQLDRSLGLIAQLMFVDQPGSANVAAELLHAAEQYLRDSGVKTIEFGGRFPLAPFYLGLYGGSRAVGVLAGDLQVCQAMLAAGFDRCGRVTINHWRLGDFRQLIDRQQLQIGRNFVVESALETFQQTWLQSCHYDPIHQKSFQLKERRTDEIVGQVAFWEMDPLIENWGISGLGLVQLEIEPDWRRKGLAKYMVGESLRQLKQLGIALVEIQHLETDTAVASLCQKLGFNNLDSTILWRKTI